MEIRVHNNNVEKALRDFKRKLQRDGLIREIREIRKRGAKRTGGVRPESDREEEPRDFCEDAREAVPELINALSNKEVSEYVAWALRQIGTPEAMKALAEETLDRRT